MVAIRLLLIEDDPQIVRALLPALKVSGHAVTVADDGSSAMALFSDEEWDALVVDLGLPDMDGKEVVKHVRASSDIPVIVISARHAGGEKAATIAAGANIFLNKPFAAPTLVESLRLVLFAGA